MLKRIFPEEDFIYFITSNTYNRYSYFANEKNCLILLKVIDELRKELKFEFYGFVIIPDHTHLMIKPALTGKHDISYIMMRIKGWSARLINVEAEHSVQQNKPAEAEPSAQQNIHVNHCSGERSIIQPFKPCSNDGLIMKPSAQQNKSVNHCSGEGLIRQHCKPCSGEGSASPYPIIWQKSFHLNHIYSLKFFNQKLNYIHNNPVKHGLVKNIEDYPWSSFRNYHYNDHSLIKIDYPEF